MHSTKTLKKVMRHRKATNTSGQLQACYQNTHVESHKQHTHHAGKKTPNTQIPVYTASKNMVYRRRGELPMKMCRALTMFDENDAYEIRRGGEMPIKKCRARRAFDENNAYEIISAQICAAKKNGYSTKPGFRRGKT